MKDKKNIFKYVIIVGVLIIPFLYSFFYLKAYWDPYGKGNIDNLPVAIVNEDEGNKGNELIKSIKNSKKLKVSVKNSSDALDGLYDGDYYAVITVPKDFTSNMESAKTDNKCHATITYAPNQKANYLASQIINSAINSVEKNLDNAVNKEIVSSLTDKLNSVPNKLEVINTGFGSLKDGTSKLLDGTTILNNGLQELQGSYKQFNTGVLDLNNGIFTLQDNYKVFNSGVINLNNGILDLQSNYQMFNNGVANINDGISKLASATTSLDELKAGAGQLVGGVSNLKTGSDNFTQGLTQYVNGVSGTLDVTDKMAQYIKMAVCPKVESQTASASEIELCAAATSITSSKVEYGGVDTINYLKTSGSTLDYSNKQINYGINELNNNVSNLGSSLGKIDELKAGINQLKTGAEELNSSSNRIMLGINQLSDGSKTLTSSSGEVTFGINKLSNGSNTLTNGSMQVFSGINQLKVGSNTLQNGVGLLDNSVLNAKDELSTNLENTKNDLTKLNGLSDYSNGPIEVLNKTVNEVSTYGTSFAPLFISIALWVGSLMLLIVLYYDKNNRFGILGIDSKKYVKRILLYHGLASLSAIILGILLILFLDFNITNMFLYFISIIIVANLFMAIIGFLIFNFGDVGKFLALIILVLQLAASGGTFPIETVTKGFRWMNDFLPMTYTIRLLKESVMTIEKNLLSTNLIIVIILFLIFFVINLVLAKRQESKNK